MTPWPLTFKLGQQHSEEECRDCCASLFLPGSAACWPLWIVGCFVLPSYLYGRETVMSFCSLTLLSFCESTSFWLCSHGYVLHPIEVSFIILSVFLQEAKRHWIYCRCIIPSITLSYQFNPMKFTIKLLFNDIKMYYDHSESFWNEFRDSQHINHNVLRIDCAALHGQ